MKRNTAIGFLAVFAMVVTVSCGLLPKAVALNDELIDKYCTATEKLREFGVNFGQGQFPGSKLNYGEGQKSDVIKIIEEAGFKDLVEFGKVNFTIAASMSVVGSEMYIENMKKLQDPETYKKNAGEMDAEFEEAFDKAAAEATAKSKVEFEKGMQMAKPILDMAKKVAGNENAALVKKNYNKIFKAMNGFDPPEVGTSGEG